MEKISIAEKRPLLGHDPHGIFPGYIEDLATGYWFSELLWAAIELEIFGLLAGAGKTPDELSEKLQIHKHGLTRFLHALTAIGLILRHGDIYCNTLLSERYLVPGKDEYLGASILWRKELLSSWKSLVSCLKTGGRTLFGSEDEDPSVLNSRIARYTAAMDCIALVKAREMLPVFEDMDISGRMLDIGSGSGALAAGFLNCFPLLAACLMDAPEVLDIAKRKMGERGLEKRTTFVPSNILEPWPLEQHQFDLIMLSNIIHAFSDAELPHLLRQAAERLKQGGILIIHDFFHEHSPMKAALFDMNMFINTYNGRVFSSATVEEELMKLGLFHTGLVPLGADTALIACSKKPNILSLLKKNRYRIRL